jgi:hypothetical protein
MVNGHPEKFRLVGMDHFNAMFEDSTTGTWWQQSTGEAVAGPLKGAALPEAESVQVTAGKWFELYPEGLVMQTDEASKNDYDVEGSSSAEKAKVSLPGPTVHPGTTNRGWSASPSAPRARPMIGIG